MYQGKSMETKTNHSCCIDNAIYDGAHGEEELAVQSLNSKKENTSMSVVRNSETHISDT